MKSMQPELAISIDKSYTSKSHSLSRPIVSPCEMSPLAQNHQALPSPSITWGKLAFVMVEEAQQRKALDRSRFFQERSKVIAVWYKPSRLVISAQL